MEYSGYNQGLDASDYSTNKMRRTVRRSDNSNPQLFDDTSQMSGYGVSSQSPEEQSYGNAGSARPNNQMQTPQEFNPVIANMAMLYGSTVAEQGQTYMNKKIDSWMSVSKIKHYFAVDTAYVWRKLLRIIFPFPHSDWSIHYQQNQNDVILPRVEHNAPDLYIPFMALVTYILVGGYVLGTQSRFTPEVLGMQASSAMAWLIVEIAIVLFALYLSNTQSDLTTLDLLAYCSYKFVGMIVCLAGGIIAGSYIYYIILSYMGASMSFFLIKTLKVKILAETTGNSTYNSKGRLYLLLVIAIMQPLLMYWHTSYLLFSKS